MIYLQHGIVIHANLLDKSNPRALGGIPEYGETERRTSGTRYCDRGAKPGGGLNRSACTAASKRKVREGWWLADSSPA